jgi:ArsR family transcriptional regulator, arsenate/arsenite/antimonite-responsive transcriptional repressor
MLLMPLPDESYERIAGVFGALANPARLKILAALVENHRSNPKWQCCVGDITSEIDLPQPSVSKHLKILRDCGILTYERKANKIYYAFGRGKTVSDLIEFLRAYRSCC